MNAIVYPVVRCLACKDDKDPCSGCSTRYSVKRLFDGFDRSVLELSAAIDRANHALLKVACVNCRSVGVLHRAPHVDDVMCYSCAYVESGKDLTARLSNPSPTSVEGFERVVREFNAVYDAHLHDLANAPTKFRSVDDKQMAAAAGYKESDILMMGLDAGVADAKSVAVYAQQGDAIRVLGLFDASTSAADVVAHAAKHGSATVVGDDGKPKVHVDIPTRDLPVLEDKPSALTTPLMSETKPVDPLDVEYDGEQLGFLLNIDRAQRKEGGWKKNGGPVHLHDWTPAQRAAVSAHWSAQLRAKVAAAKQAERNVVTYCEEDEL